MKNIALSVIAFAFLSCNSEDASTKTPPAAPGFEKVLREGFSLDKPAGWDPTTGENIEVQSSDRYFFRHNDPVKDVIVGTTTNDNPAPLDMRQLIEAPSR